MSHLFYDKTSDSLLVTGQFDTVAGAPCRMVAMWSFQTKKWHCLVQNFDAFSGISAAYKDPSGKTLYIAGKINSSSSEARHKNSRIK